VTDSEPQQEHPPKPTSTPWRQPDHFGYSETLRGLGGVVAPLLTGFSLTSIALVLTASSAPRDAEWAVVALASTVACLLYSMQVAVLALARSPSPADILTWRPETAVSDAALQSAREQQAATFADMKRLWDRSALAYDLGIIAFLFGLLLLLIPHSWSVAHCAAVGVASLALAGELYWALANHCEGVGRDHHPVVRDSKPSDFKNKLEPLNEVGYAAVRDPARRGASGSYSEPGETAASAGSAGPRT